MGEQVEKGKAGGGLPRAPPPARRRDDIDASTLAKAPGLAAGGDLGFRWTRHRGMRDGTDDGSAFRAGNHTAVSPSHVVTRGPPARCGLRFLWKCTGAYIHQRDSCGGRFKGVEVFRFRRLRAEEGRLQVSQRLRQEGFLRAFRHTDEGRDPLLLRSRAASLVERSRRADQWRIRAGT